MVGQAKQNRQRHRDLVATEPRCVYCANAPDSLEHMPPIGMFRNRSRPRGLEFASCQQCNVGTRGADAVACYIARLEPFESATTGALIQEAVRLETTLDLHAPGVRQEIFGRPDKQRVEWVRNRAGVLVKSVRLVADGPLLKAYLQVFAAKLAMALFREHTGVALPVDVPATTAHFLNAGLTQGAADSLLSMLPGGATLKQGRFDAGSQFAYRWNSDNRSVVAALVRFHQGLYVFAAAATDPRIQEVVLTLPNASLVRPGGLLRLLPGSAAAPQEEPSPQGMAPIFLARLP